MRKLFWKVGEALVQLRVGIIAAIIGAVLTGFNVSGLFEVGIDTTLQLVRAIIWFTFIIVGIAIFLELVGNWLGNLLIEISEWYPRWYYFPKIRAEIKVTPESELTMTVAKSKRVKDFYLIVVFDRMTSQTTALSFFANGVSPPSPPVKRMLFPWDLLTGQEPWTRKIGEIKSGSVIFSMGEDNKSVIEITSPGLYNYYFKFAGEFRGREFKGGGCTGIKLTESLTVEIKECYER